MKRSAVLFAILLLSGLTAFAAQKQPEVIAGEYLVKIKSEYRHATRDQLEQALGSEVIQSLSPESGVVLVRRPITESIQKVVARFKENRAVEFSEPNYVQRILKTPNDAQYGKLWGMNNVGQADPKDPAKLGKAGVDIGAEKAWDITTGSKNVVVAVIDTGIDNTHEDLKDNMWVNAAEKNGKAGVDDDNNGFVDDVYGWDFANNKANGFDDHAHGSHCSGTIGGKADNGKGVAGVNWNVSLMAVKFLDSQGSGSLANAVSAIDYATKMGANVMSNSWGGGGFSQALKEAIERSAAAGALFVAAAGNETNDNDASPTYPATYDVDNVLAVAAVDNKGQIASFSNWGKTTVDLAAPGVSILSSTPGNQYSVFSGTSMATPHVSGVAALVLSANPGMTYKELKQRLISTVTKMGNLKSKTAAGGMVNAYNALTNTTAPADPNDPTSWKQQAITLSTPHPYKDKADQTFEVKVPGAKKLAILFDKFEVEREYAGQVYDKVEFFDGNGKLIDTWTGTHTGEYSPAIEGDTVRVHLVSDDSYSLYGFDATKAAVQF